MIVKSGLLKIALFLGLSAVSVVGYLFLLTVFRGKLGAFSAAVPAMAVALAALLLNQQFFRREGRSFVTELGFDAPRRRLLLAVIAFVAGSALVGLWALAITGVTGVSWRPAPSFDAIAALGAFTFALFNNAGEELLYRGYLFLLLARSYGRAVAVIGTCGLFTLLHIQGGVPWQNAIAGVLTSALIYAALFTRWQSIPIVLAFHVGMNVAQELIGIRASGLTIFVPAYAAPLSESRSLTILVITGVLNTVAALAIFAGARAHRTGRDDPSS